MNASKIPSIKTIRETAKETGVSEYFIRQLVRDNKIYYFKSGKRFLLNFDYFVDFLNGKHRDANKEE